MPVARPSHVPHTESTVMLDAGYSIVAGTLQALVTCTSHRYPRSVTCMIQSVPVMHLTCMLPVTYLCQVRSWDIPGLVHDCDMPATGRMPTGLTCMYRNCCWPVTGL